MSGSSKPVDWPVFVSFFTPAYERVALDLTATLIKFDLPHIVRKVEDRGSWVKNCAYKPKFIWQMMEEHPNKPICWIDADAMVEEFPILFRRRLDCDVAVHTYRKPNRNRSEEVLSGTVYLAPTYRARLLVDRWIEECYLNPNAWDQRALQASMAKIDGLKVYPLPVTYAFIFDIHRTEHPGKAPVILHRQYSRIIKRRKGR